MRFDIVSSEEKRRFLEAYKQANRISSQGLKKTEEATKKKPSSSIICTDAEANFLKELRKIKSKSKELRENADKNPALYLKAAQAAEKLYSALSDAKDEYCENRNAATYKVFQEACDSAITTARDELEIHRGWKNVLCNVGAAVAGLGVFYLAAVAVNYYKTNGKHLFFQFNTDSVNRMEHFQNAVAIAAPVA
ncbi:MAG: hypothetical protein ACRCXC_10250 [Legionella sp.]